MPNVRGGTVSVTYNHLSIYEILSMLGGDLSADPALILEAFDENPEYKPLVIQCSRGEITYTALLERVNEII